MCVLVRGDFTPPPPHSPLSARRYSVESKQEVANKEMPQRSDVSWQTGDRMVEHQEKLTLVASPSPSPPYSPSHSPHSPTSSSPHSSPSPSHSPASSSTGRLSLVRLLLNLIVDFLRFWLLK